VSHCLCVAAAARIAGRWPRIPRKGGRRLECAAEVLGLARTAPRVGGARPTARGRSPCESRARRPAPRPTPGEHGDAKRPFSCPTRTTLGELALRATIPAQREQRQAKRDQRAEATDSSGARDCCRASLFVWGLPTQEGERLGPVRSAEASLARMVKVGRERTTSSVSRIIATVGRVMGRSEL
jgi:hypothetical protein